MMRLVSAIAVLFVCLLHADEAIPADQPAQSETTSLLQFDYSRLEPVPTPPRLRVYGEYVFLRELYSLRQDRDYRIAKEMGFNAVIERSSEAFPLAREFGFYVTVANWFGDTTDPASIQEVAETWKGYPRLISLNLNDEPDLRDHLYSAPSLQRARDTIKAVSGDLRTSLTLAGWGRSQDSWPDYAKAADIIRIDPYPLVAGKPLSHVSELFRDAREIAPDKPIITILQAWAWGGGGLPSPDQMRNMIWQSIMAGAAGISFFDWNDTVWVQHPEFWQTLREEILSLVPLSPLLADPETVWYPQISNGNVHMRLLSGRDGQIIALVVNQDHLPARISIALPESLTSPDSPVRVPFTVPAGDAEWVPLTMHDFYPKDEPLHASNLQISPEPDQTGPEFSDLQIYHVDRGRERTLILHSCCGSADISLQGWYDYPSQTTAEDSASLVSLEKVMQFRRIGARHRSRTIQRQGTNAYKLMLHPPVGRDYPSKNRSFVRLLVTCPDGSQHTQDIRVAVYEPISVTAELLNRSPESWQLRTTIQTDLTQGETGPAWLRYEGAGVTITKLATDTVSNQQTLTMSVFQAVQDLPPSTLRADVMAEAMSEEPIASIGLQQYAIRDGQLIHPDDPAEWTASYRSAMPNFASPIFPDWRQGNPMRDFRSGPGTFADKAHRAWLSWNENGLFWFAEAPGDKRQVRAGMRFRDDQRLGDYLLGIFLRNAREQLIMIQVNPEGQTTDRVLQPDRIDSWSPELTITTRRTDTGWELAAYLPWVEIGFLDGPPSGGKLQLNLSATYDIAPSYRDFWHPVFQSGPMFGTVWLEPPPEETAE